MPAPPLPGTSSSCLDAGQYGPPVPGDFDPWSSWVIKYGCQVVNACAQILLYNGVEMCKKVPFGKMHINVYPV